MMMMMMMIQLDLNLKWSSPLIFWKIETKLEIQISFQFFSGGGGFSFDEQKKNQHRFSHHQSHSMSLGSLFFLFLFHWIPFFYRLRSDDQSPSSTSESKKHRKMVDTKNGLIYLVPIKSNQSFISFHYTLFQHQHRHHHSEWV